MTSAKLSKKYQIVVPKEVRQKMQLAAGTQVTIFPLDATRAVLVKYPKDYVGALKGMGKEVWRSLGGAGAYIKQGRASWEK